MRVSYQNANPHRGHESYYIKFEDVSSTTTNCMLVDSGEGVNVEEDLGDDEYLSAILLTHAHADHYQTLGDNIKDGAKVLTTPATASVLETVLSEASKYAETDGVGWNNIEDSVEPITDWYSLTADVDVRPVSAGHVPGACGYLIRFDEDRHILSTGDFTFDRAAGYPPLPKYELTELGVDVLFLNASTSESDGLTESVDSILEQAVSGGHVLVSASGMTCVKYVYILGHLIEEYDMNMSVSIAGQAAKIYEDLEYEVPNVSSHPVYDSTDGILESDISVAGPEKPVEGSSKKLFEEIRDDPSAALVRILGSYSRWNETAGCTVMDFKQVNHPTEDELYGFVEDLNPIQTVVQHGETRKWGDVFDFTLTWADDKTESRVLYSDGDWESPIWLEEGTYEMILQKNKSNRGPDMTGIIGGDVGEILDSDFPSLERAEEPSLSSEGIQLDEIPQRTSVSSREKEAETEPSEETEDAEATSCETVSAQEVHDTLERIENQLNSETHEAVVVDTAGGDLLLRLNEKSPEDLGLKHGEAVEISFRKD
jgi:putative mRNA 3-end processing factor